MELPRWSTDTYLLFPDPRVSYTTVINLHLITQVVTNRVCTNETPTTQVHRRDHSTSEHCNTKHWPFENTKREHLIIRKTKWHNRLATCVQVNLRRNHHQHIGATDRIQSLFVKQLQCNNFAILFSFTNIAKQSRKSAEVSRKLDSLGHICWLALVGQESAWVSRKSAEVSRKSASLAHICWLAWVGQGSA